jgi:hypothetical protein
MRGWEENRRWNGQQKVYEMGVQVWWRSGRCGICFYPHPFSLLCKMTAKVLFYSSVWTN